MGLSFGEIFVLAVVALVVVGPKDLPRILRAVGQFLGQARRAIAEVRRETGLEEVLRGDFRDLERLADHIERLEPYRGDAPAIAPRDVIDWHALRTREYPVAGADAADLIAEDAAIYRDLPAMSAVATPALEGGVAAATTSTARHDEADEAIVTLPGVPSGAPT